MKEADYQKLMKIIKAKESRVKTFGIKGVSPHDLMRAIFTILEERIVLSDEKHAHKDLPKQAAFIKQHFVRKAQGTEYAIPAKVGDGLGKMYLIVRNIAILRNAHLKHLRATMQDYNKNLKPKVNAQTRKEVLKLFKDVSDWWKAQLKAMRQELNAVNAMDAGKSGWALSLFNKTRTEGGAMYRWREKRETKEGLKADHKEQSMAKRLRKLRSVKELSKWVVEFRKKEEVVRKAHTVLDKMLFATWEHLISMLREEAGVVHEAVNKHELPRADAEHIDNVVNAEITLSKKELQGIRLIINQLEGSWKDMDDARKKAA
ncbi:hypothetical protein ACFL0V_06885 [Nanoarchaeota archaeon]